LGFRDDHLDGPFAHRAGVGPRTGGPARTPNTRRSVATVLDQAIRGSWRLSATVEEARHRPCWL